MEKTDVNTALAILLLASAAVVMIGGLAVTTISQHAAFAARNCEGDIESGSTCTGGAGGQSTAEGLTISGGFGERQVVEPGGDPATLSGGGGDRFCIEGTDECSVGGRGGNLFCDPVCGTDDPGGSGFHTQGPGGNSGN